MADTPMAVSLLKWVGCLQSSNGATTVDPNAIVAAVNAKRAQHNSPPVTWDPTIASYSQNYAEKLASQQQG